MVSRNSYNMYWGQTHGTLKWTSVILNSFYLRCSEDIVPQKFFPERSMLAKSFTWCK